MSLLMKGDKPFQCGSDVIYLPPTPLKDVLIVRVESGGSFQVNIKVMSQTLPSQTEPEVSATNADIFLVSGDAYEFKQDQLKDISQLHFIAITGNPKIYWVHL